MREISGVQFIQTATSMASMLDFSLIQKTQWVENIARDPVIIREMQTDDYSDTRIMLADYYDKMQEDLEDIGTFSREGLLLTDGTNGSKAGIDISEREYFLQMISGESVISDLIISKATGEPVFMICTPVTSEHGEILGGILAVMKAEYLIKYVNSMKIGKTGYSFLVNHEGDLQIHPFRMDLLYQDANTVTSLKGFLEQLGETATGFFEYSFEGRDRFCGYALVTQTNWFLIVSQDTRETMQIAAANMKYTLAFNILFLLLGTAFLVYFSNQISSPVTQNLVRLNSAVSQAAEAFIIIDEKQNLQFYNIAAVQLIEGTPEMNRPCKIGNLDKGELISIIDSVTEKGHWNGKIGETMDLTVTPVNDSQSKSTSFLLIGRDMTTEIQLQQQIIQSQRMDAIGTLTSGISHDFNNILTGILGYIDLSLMSLDDRENLEAYILEIQNASVRAVDLISHIMAYSHKNDHKVKHISLKYIVKDTLKLVHASLPATITIQEFYESSSPILADPTAIHQLIMNLCINAGYAMKKRGGNLDVELRELKGSEVRKTHSEATEKSYLCLTIRDSGTGIKPEILEKIFDPFFTTKPQGEGTGIGLPTVHNIVRNLEGFISVESETGKGTAFFIYFPVSNFDEETGNEQIGTDFPGGSEHILVIDDEKVITNSTKSRLEKLGYTVSTYNDSLKGLDAFIKAPQNYDLILTDYTMPQMVGSFLIKEARKIREDIPVIISSGDLSISGEIQDMKNVLFLKKPLLTQELTMNIRKILDKK